MFIKAIDLAIWVTLVVGALTAVSCSIHMGYVIARSRGIRGVMTHLAGLTTIASSIIVPLTLEWSLVGVVSAILFVTGYAVAYGQLP